MHIARALHIVENILLQLWHRLQRVWHFLVLLNVLDDLGRFGPLGEIDQIRRFDDGWNAVFDKCQVCEIYAYALLLDCGTRGKKEQSLPKKGIHGGITLWRVSRYSPKFFVLPIRRRMASRTLPVRAGVCSHVRLRRWIGAVLNAEMMEVSVEKLLRFRHF